MKKIISLIKVSLNHDMSIFKIHTKKNSKITKFIIPTFLTLYIMFIIGMYAEKIINVLQPLHLEFVLLTLFATSISLLTLIEGIYKSNSLLFNCKDDDLLFSLPIKKRSILFIRILKLYVFEFLYNSMFLLPAIIIYATKTSPNWTYYLVSIIALAILPIVPIIISIIIGFFIAYSSTKFKKKSAFQTVITMLILLVTLYVSYNAEAYIKNIGGAATNINNTITRIYYPVKVYISLVNNFNVITLIKFIFSHLIAFWVVILLLGKKYFNINSNSHKTIVNYKNKAYKIKSSNKMKAFIKKEINRFISTPVFMINTGFGLFLFVALCVSVVLKFDDFSKSLLSSSPNLTIQQIKSYLPLALFGAVCFTSLMTSITSSMISLEGKTFSILKSLPLRANEIVLYKVISAITIMIPCILIGDIIIFTFFSFNLLMVLLIVIASIILPIVSETIGIIVNLKYPKLDATNDTEIVKQSLSSLVSVFIGMGLTAITGLLMIKMVDIGLNNHIIILSIIVLYMIILIGLWIYLFKNSEKNINDIST